MSFHGDWLAAHLFYSEPWEPFLVHAVKPFAEMVVSQKWVEKYFFIRYWDQGPHIRLRLQGNRETLVQIVKPLLEAHFQEYFALHRSERTKRPSDHTWYPNNSVQFVPYVPEVQRYGGPASIDIAEKQFYASSEAVLSVVTGCVDWHYERALGAAIQLHLAFAHAMGMDLEEARQFFAYLCQRWLAYAYGTSLGQNLLPARHTELLHTFAQKYERQQRVLISYHNTVWQGLVKGALFEADWFNRWVRAMYQVSELLQEIQGQQQLIPPSRFRYDPEFKTAVANQQRWSILESYIHMTNNRLGVLNHDEAYLGYLIKRSLDSIAVAGREPLHA